MPLVPRMCAPSERLGQHQHVEWCNAYGAHGIDLLGHRHGANLRRVGGTGAAGDYDGGDQRSKLSQHRKRDQIDDKDVGAIEAQLRGPLIGDDDAEQKGEQTDDGQGIDTCAADVVKNWAPANPCRMGQPATQGEGALADEGEQGAALCQQGHRALTQAFQAGQRPG